MFLKVINNRLFFYVNLSKNNIAYNISQDGNFISFNSTFLNLINLKRFIKNDFKHIKSRFFSLKWHKLKFQQT